MAQPLVRLGCCDQNRIPDDLDSYLSQYHEYSMSKTKFRGEKNSQWYSLKSIEGNAIESLQESLCEFGFYPEYAIDGIFGYRTESAVRLFQEYIRFTDNEPTMNPPDGIVGSNTWKQIDQWKADNRSADWLAYSVDNPSDEFDYWHRIIEEVRTFENNIDLYDYFYRSDDVDIPSDTLKSDEWNFDRDTIHIIGIRRREWVGTGYHGNNDLFILLVNGMVFKFYGSTDPTKNMSKYPNKMPFLIRGQHVYRFGWHKFGNSIKCYRALKPHQYGPLVLRDITQDGVLTEEDSWGEVKANEAINIHWSGSGRANWSAGCQVIAGKGYINHNGDYIDCSNFASRDYTNLGRKFTKAAYNVFTDLITVFTNNIKCNGDRIYYTLLFERDIESGEETLRDYILSQLGLTLELSDIVTIETVLAQLGIVDEE